MPPDVSCRPRRLLPALLLLLGVGITGLGGCASAPSSTASRPPSLSQPQPLPETVPPTPVAAARQGAPSAEPRANDAAVPDEAGAVKFLLDHAERLRVLNPAELGAAISALGEAGNQPLAQLQLALALTHTHQPVDTARAIGLLQRVLAQEGAAARPYKALARLLLTRLQEQRKLEDSLERQSQQLREQQRRIEQLNERLEAMRAIERSLNTRPGTPLNGPTRPATPP
jgi:hypothetical protein